MPATRAALSSRLIRTGLSVHGHAHARARLLPAAWERVSTARSLATSTALRMRATPVPCASTVTESGSLPKPEKFQGLGRDGKERLVIIGTGWAGHILLQDLDLDKYEVHVISPNPNFTMTPLLAQSAVGTLDFRAVIEPIVSSHQLNFHRAWVDAIDIDNKTLDLTGAQPPTFREVDPLLPPEEQQQLGVPVFSRTPPSPPRTGAQQTAHMSTSTASSNAATMPSTLENGVSAPKQRTKSTLKFDKLVIAHGSYNRTFSTPGVKANALFLKDVNNGRQIRWRLISCLEQANNPDLSVPDKRKLLTWIVVGGGPTGSELIGELSDLVHDDIRRRFPNLVPLIKLILIDAGKTILNSFDAELAEYARKHFVTGNVDLRLERHITSVSPGVLHVKEDGEIHYGMLVWSTGVTASPLTRSIKGIQKASGSGALLTDDRLHALKAVQGEETAELQPVKPDFTETTTDAHGKQVRKYDAYKDIFAVGDAAVIQGAYLPATAQVAKAKARYVAAQLNADLGHVRSCDVPLEQGEAKSAQAPQLHPFEFQSRGQITSLGSRAAIMQNKGWRGRLTLVKGPPAWALWSSAYSLMSSKRNRLAVPFGWFLMMLFGRDLTRF